MQIVSQADSPASARRSGEESRAVWLLLCPAAKTHSVGHGFLHVDRVEPVSLLIKCFGRGCGGGSAQVGMVPSPRRRPAALSADPCGGEFTHVQSVALRAVQANGQDCHFAIHRDAAAWRLIMWFTSKTLRPGNKENKSLLAVQNKWELTAKMSL